MNLYTTMKNGMTMDLDQKLEEIRQDLIWENADELSNRREFYTRKYRGNRLNDVNVGIWENIDKSISVQIFLRNKEGFRKEIYKIRRLPGGFTEVNLGQNG